MVTLIKSLVLKILNKLLIIKFKIESLWIPTIRSKGKVCYHMNPSFYRTLILVPHADDELIGCYQYILRSQGKSTLFYFNFTGADTTEQNRMTRKTEFVNFCKSVDVKYIIADPLGDRVLQLISAIRDVTPNMILLPSVVDWLGEHRATNTILLKALSQIKYTGSFIWYHISVPIPAKYITETLPMSKKEYKTKWKAFYLYYPSQSFINISRFQLEERHVDKDSYAAEVYKRISLSDLIYATSLFEEKNQGLSELKTLLTHYGKLHALSESIYDKIYKTIR